MKLRSLKFEEVSHEMLVLMLQHVSSRVAGLLVPSQCLWGKLRNLSLLKVSKQVVMSFCLARVALPDIFTRLQTRRKSFCVAGAILLRRFQKMICSFRGRHSTLETSDAILRGRRNTLDVSCSLLFLQIPMPGLRQVVTLNTPHSTLHTLQFTLYTPHFTLYTPHFTLNTLHSTLYTPHFTLYTLDSTRYTPHLHPTLYTPHFTLHTLHFTLYAPHFTLYTPHFTLYTVHYTLHFTLYTLHFTLHTLHFTLHTLHSTL